MGRVGGKRVQRLIAQGFFQGFAILVGGNVAHHDAQIGMRPLNLENFLNAAVGAFEIGPEFHDVALKAVHGPAV